MQSTEIGSDSDKDTLVYNDYTLKGNWKCIFNAAKALHRTLCSSSLDFFQVPPTPWSIADDRYSWARPSLRTIESYCFLFWPKPAPTICFQNNFLSHRYSINKWSPLPPQEWRLEVINRILTTGSQVSFWAFWGVGERIEMVYFQAILKRLGIFFFFLDWVSSAYFLLEDAGNQGGLYLHVNTYLMIKFRRKGMLFTMFQTPLKWVRM